MPVGLATPDIKATRLAPEMVLSFGRAAESTPITLTPEQKAHQQRLEQTMASADPLKGLRFWQSAEDGPAAVDSGYRSTQASEDAEEFGGQENPVHGDQKENRHRAEKEFQEKSQVLEFARILQSSNDEAVQRQVYIRLQQRDSRFTSISFEDFYNNSVEIMARDETVARVIDKFEDKLTPQQVVEMIANDPSFVGLMSEKIKVASIKVRELKQPNSIELNSNDQNVKRAEANLDQKCNDLVTIFAKEGIKLGGKDINIDDVKRIIGGLNNPARLEQEMARLLDIPPFNLGKLKEKDQIETEILRLDREKRPLQREGARIMQLQRDVARIESENSGYSGKYNRLKGLMNGQLGTVALEAIRLDGDIKLNRVSSSDNLPDGMRTRLNQERDILNTLESSIGDVTAEMFEGRLKTMLEAEKKLHAKDAEADTQKINGRIETNWVAYDSARRKTMIYGDRIVADLRILATARDAGTKLLMARDLGLINDRDLTPLLKERNIRPLTPEQQQDLISNLLARIDSDPRHVGLDKIVGVKGAEYRRKLMSSTMTMREYLGEGFMGMKLRLGDKTEFVGKRNIMAYLTGGPMDANGQEWKMLCERYGSDLDQALQSNEKAKGIMDNLKEKGITPDSKMKYLLWFLLIILGLGLGGAPGILAGVGGLTSPGIAAAVGGVGALGGRAVGKAVGQRFVQ